MSKHQNLINLESTINKMMATLTNDMYIQGVKFKYILTWIKGTGCINDGMGNVSKDYYTLKMTVVDKTNSLEGKHMDLYVNHYPVKGVVNVNLLHEQALIEFLTNGVRSLFNITFAQYQEQLKAQHVKEEDAKVDEKIQMLRESANNVVPLFKG